MEIKGRTYAGPLKVATRWKIKETSVCPIGADELAKVRADAGQNDEPQKHAGANRRRPERSQLKWKSTKLENRKENGLKISTFYADSLTLTTRCEPAGSIRAQRLTLFGPQFSKSSRLDSPQGIGYRGPLDDYHPATVTHDATDKRVAAQVDGLLLRAGVISERDEKNKPAPGANEYGNFSLLDHAKECLRASGQAVHRIP